MPWAELVQSWVLLASSAARRGGLTRSRNLISLSNAAAAVGGELTCLRRDVCLRLVLSPSKFPHFGGLLHRFASHS